MNAKAQDAADNRISARAKVTAGSFRSPGNSKIDRMCLLSVDKIMSVHENLQRHSREACPREG
ncbi:MAG: hypothetical protein K6U78_12935, partial [Anaerolineae bacterium]|nr:hypothetical protein [Anaerolineae bacterium]